MKYDKFNTFVQICKVILFCPDSEIAAAIREPIENPTTREAQNLFYRSKIEMIW